VFLGRVQRQRPVALVVIKVRGNAGERRSWAPKIVGERSQAPYNR